VSGYEDLDKSGVFQGIALQSIYFIDNGSTWSVRIDIFDAAGTSLFYDFNVYYYTR
jgi:hypothetical protein